MYIYKGTCIYMHLLINFFFCFKFFFFSSFVYPPPHTHTLFKWLRQWKLQGKSIFSPRWYIFHDWPGITDILKVKPQCQPSPSKPLLFTLPTTWNRSTCTDRASFMNGIPLSPIHTSSLHKPIEGKVNIGFDFCVFTFL